MFRGAWGEVLLRNYVNERDFFVFANLHFTARWRSEIERRLSVVGGWRWQKLMLFFKPIAFSIDDLSDGFLLLMGQFVKSLLIC